MQSILNKNANSQTEAKTMKKRLHALYLSWFNDFLSVEYFAEYYSLTLEQAMRCIDIGRRIHNLKAN